MADDIQSLFAIPEIQTQGQIAAQRNKVILDDLVASAATPQQQAAVRLGSLFGGVVGGLKDKLQGVDPNAPVITEAERKQIETVSAIQEGLDAKGLSPDSPEGLKFAGKKFQEAGMLDRALKAGERAEEVLSQRKLATSKERSTLLDQEHQTLVNEKLRLEMEADKAAGDADIEAFELNPTQRAAVENLWNSYNQNTRAKAEVVGRIEGFANLIDAADLSPSGFMEVAVISGLAKIMDPGGRITDADFRNAAEGAGVAGTLSRLLSAEALKGGKIGPEGRKELRRALVAMGQNRVEEIRLEQASIRAAARQQRVPEELVFRSYGSVDRFASVFGTLKQRKAAAASKEASKPAIRKKPTGDAGDLGFVPARQDLEEVSRLTGRPVADIERELNLR